MRYSRAVIERFYARAHPKRPNRQQVNIYQWLEAVVLNLFFHRAHYGPSARIMGMLLKYYVINTNQPDL